MKPDDPNVTETRLDEKNGTVDLTLKVKEKGKNGIGLNGGVSGLAGAFIGINYSTNNFLGLGETLAVQTSIGNASVFCPSVSRSRIFLIVRFRVVFRYSPRNTITTRRGRRLSLPVSK